MATREMVYINVGWMLAYKGGLKHDPIRGGHEYLRSNGEGHEAFNFAQKNGTYYGHVPGKNNIRIRNFRHHTRDRATGVTVVWVARHAELHRYVIVGWYEDATILRSPERGAWKLAGEPIDCQIIATRSIVIGREQRTFPAPDMPQIAFGRSVIYYGSGAVNRNVMRFIESQGRWQGRQAQKSRKRAGRQQDPEERRRIEKAAVEHAKAYYREQFDDDSCVESVEALCKGWDLEVEQLSGELLYVEVKGNSGNESCAELTVNEYRQMRDPEIRSRYVVYIVTEAGTKNAKRHIFRFRERAGSTGDWVSDDGRTLDFEPLLAARIAAPKLGRRKAA